MRKIKAIIFIVGSIGLAMTIVVTNYGRAQNITNALEVKYYVPDESTAIKIAEAVWLPIYGDGIYKKKPFKAILKDSAVWVVTGSIHHEKGGVPIAEIQRQDGRILKITHSK